jgi:hypothetical protein
MKNESTNINASNNQSNTSSGYLNTSCRLVIKNIPENFSNEQMTDLLNKNFENKISNILIIKLDHKFNLKNNKICYLTAENLEVRKAVTSFFSTFELVDPKGFKQKLSVVDCLYQTKTKEVKDPLENTIDTSNYLHYLFNFSVSF